MTSRWWPLWDLRLRIDDLELAPAAETDLDELARIVPPDLELNPAATRYPGLDERTWRGVVLHQEYWKALGTWSPDDWRVYFVVRRASRVLGVQGLEGPDFRRLRTVDSSSWLVDDARGTGVGKAMRTAVLALAFGPLGALAAVTSALQDTHASLGVSRAVGYRPNGESFHPGPDGVDTLVHLRMTRRQWLDTGAAGRVRIEGFDAARPLFGLEG